MWVCVCQYLSKCVKFLKDYVNISKFLRISAISHIFQANDIPIHPSRTEEETYKIPYKLIPITAHTHIYILQSNHFLTQLHSTPYMHFFPCERRRNWETYSEVLWKKMIQRSRRRFEIKSRKNKTKMAKNNPELNKTLYYFNTINTTCPRISRMCLIFGGT